MSTPDASSFGPDRIALMVIFVDATERVRQERNFDALMVARCVSEGDSQRVVDSALKHFRDSERRLQGLADRFSFLVSGDR